jgi:hypothetical protein
MRNWWIFLGVALIINISMSFNAYAQPDNDECQSADTLNFWWGDRAWGMGTTTEATPSANLTAECCNDLARDVWFVMFDQQNFRYFYACAERNSGQVPEVGVIMIAPDESGNLENNNNTICADVNCMDFNTFNNARGLGYQRGRIAHAENFVAQTDYQGLLGYDALFVVKEINESTEGSFWLRIGSLQMPTVIAGSPTQYYCLSPDTTYSLRASVTAANGGTIANMKWQVLNEYNGKVASLTPDNSIRTNLKLSGTPPYKVALRLIAYETVNIECSDQTWPVDSITGIDTTIIVVHQPKLDYPDTFYVPKNVPRTIPDNMESTGCLDNQEKFTWSPDLSLNNVNLRNPSVIANRDKNYIVTMNCNGCEDSEKVVVKIREINGITKDNNFNIYFNQSQLVMQSQEISLEQFNVRLYNIKGALVFNLHEKDFTVYEGKNVYDVSKYSLQKGVYFVVADVNGNIVKNKLLFF